jgi:hypothetical protein
VSAAAFRASSSASSSGSSLGQGGSRSGDVAEVEERAAPSQEQLRVRGVRWERGSRPVEHGDGFLVRALRAGVIARRDRPTEQRPGLEGTEDSVVEPFDLEVELARSYACVERLGDTSMTGPCEVVGHVAADRGAHQLVAEAPTIGTRLHENAP